MITEMAFKYYLGLIMFAAGFIVTGNAPAAVLCMITAVMTTLYFCSYDENVRGVMLRPWYFSAPLLMTGLFKENILYLFLTCVLCVSAVYWKKYLYRKTIFRYYLIFSGFLAAGAVMTAVLRDYNGLALLYGLQAPLLSTVLSNLAMQKKTYGTNAETILK